MALNFGSGLFGENRGREILQNPAKQATVIVAKDGSGDTDDIKDGISLLPAEGGIVQIKEGIYFVDTEILINKNNVTVEGIGEGTQIKTIANIKIFHINNVEGVKIRNIRIVGNNIGANQYGVYGTNIDNGILDNLRILNCKASAIFIDNSSDLNIITDCNISGSGTDNIYIAGSETIISNCLLRTAGGNGIVIFDNIRATISDCIIRDNTNDGISLNDADDCIVSNNHCVGNTEYGVELEGAGENNNIITSNNLSNNTIAGLLDGGVSTTAANNEL